MTGPSPTEIERRGLAQTAEFFGETMTAAEVTEAILIGHPQGHLESFKAATGQG